MDLQLSGLRALVTGGTRGIGRAIVEAFLAEGTSVAFCARHADAVKATQDALSIDGTTVLGTALDVGDADALTAWVTNSAEAMGGIDIIVSNVSALAIEDKPENWTASFEVDLMAAVRMVNAAMPYLEASSAPSHHRDIQRFRTGDRLRGRSVRDDQGGADPLPARSGESVGRQGDSRQLGIAGQYLLRGRRMGEHRAEPARPVLDRDGAEPDRPDGLPGGDRAHCRVRVEPGIEPHERREHPRRRGVVARGPALGRDLGLAALEHR